MSDPEINNENKENEGEIELQEEEPKLNKEEPKLNEENNKDKGEDSEELLKKMKEKINEKSSDIDNLGRDVTGAVTGKGGDIIAKGVPAIFDTKTRTDIIKSIKDVIPGGGVGVGLIVFIIGTLFFVISMIVGIFYVLAAVTAAVFAMKLNKDKKGLAKYSKMMRAFAIGVPYILYGSFIYKE